MHLYACVIKQPFENGAFSNILLRNKIREIIILKYGSTEVRTTNLWIKKPSPNPLGYGNRAARNPSFCNTYNKQSNGINVTPLLHTWYHSLSRKSVLWCCVRDSYSNVNYGNFFSVVNIWIGNSYTDIRLRFTMLVYTKACVHHMYNRLYNITFIPWRLCIINKRILADSLVV